MCLFLSFVLRRMDLSVSFGALTFALPTNKHWKWQVIKAFYFLSFWLSRKKKQTKTRKNNIKIKKVFAYKSNQMKSFCVLNVVVVDFAFVVFRALSSHLVFHSVSAFYTSCLLFSFAPSVACQEPKNTRAETSVKKSERERNAFKFAFSQFSRRCWWCCRCCLLKQIRSLLHITLAIINWKTDFPKMKFWRNSRNTYTRTADGQQKISRCRRGVKWAANVLAQRVSK